MRSTITHALAALLVGAATAAAALAADSTGIGLPDVPWQKPWARTADALQGMPTSCPEGQVLTVGVNGAFSCVEASSSTNPCSTTATLVGGKTYAACCAAGGYVVQANTDTICRIPAASCPTGWISYFNWSATSSSSFSQLVAVNPLSCFFQMNNDKNCSTSSHAWGNSARESCTVSTLPVGGDTGSCYLPGGPSSYTVYATVTAVGCR